MNAAEFQFRTAAIGGFQKQDVLNYIEAFAQEHTEKEAALEQELAQLRQEYRALEQRCQEGEERLAALTAESRELEDDLIAKTEALETAQDERSETTRLLGAAQVELAELRERVKLLEPAAAAYEGVKERTAGVELEAHRRAQVIEEQARTKSEAAAQTLEQWLGRVRTEYVGLRSAMDDTLSHAIEELVRMGQSLGTLTKGFETHDAALERIEADVRNGTAPKPPKPLPLDEA